MGLADRADRAGLDALDHLPVVLARVVLGAHLRGDAGLRGGLAEDPGLLHVVRHRLFEIDVLAQEQRRQGRRGVGVLGGADDDGIEAVGVVVEPAEVGVAAGLGVFGGGAIDGRLVNVAERDDIFRGNL